MASISNNSNIPLASGATFNGLYELLSAGAESVQISVKSDEPGVLRVFFAQTPLVLLYEKSYTYTAGQYFFVSVPKIAQYFRCNFTNSGAVSQTYFELRTTFNNYLLVDEPTTGTGAIVQVSNFPTVQDVSDATTHAALGSMLTELISINNEILNPTAVQVITGTVFSQGQGSPDGGTTWEPIKTTSGAQNVIVDSITGTVPVSIAGTVPVSGTVAVSSITNPVSISGTVPVSIAGTVPVSGSVSISSGSVSFTNGSINSYSYGSPDGAITWEPLKTTLGVQNVIVDSITSPVSISGTVPVSGSVAVSSISGSVGVSGTVSSQCYGSTNSGTSWHPLKTTGNGELITKSLTQDGNGTDITSTNLGTIQALDVAVKNSVSISGTVPVSIASTVGVSGSVAVSSVAGSVSVVNATGSELAVKKPDPVAFSVYSGAIAAVGVYGSVDLNGYSSFDLLVYQPGGSVSVAGSLYIMVSNDGVNWFLNQSYSVYIYSQPSDRRYMTTYPSLNCRYVAVTAESPFGGSGFTSTNSVITLSAKK